MSNWLRTARLAQPRTSCALPGLEFASRTHADIQDTRHSFFVYTFILFVVVVVSFVF